MTQLSLFRNHIQEINMQLTHEQPIDYRRVDNEDGHSETVIFRILLSVLPEDLTEEIQIILEDYDEVPFVTVKITASGMTAHLVDHADKINIMLLRSVSDKLDELHFFGTVEYTTE